MNGARRYLAAGVEQALWSVLNLGVNLALVRYLTPHAYGGFVFWANVGFMLASLQNAVTICHLQVLAPAGPTAFHRVRVERLMHAVNGLFLFAVALCVLAVVVLLGPASDYATPQAALFVTAFLLQQYVRALNFSRGRPVASAIQTALVLAIAAPLLVGIIIVDPHPDAGTVMLAMGFAYGVVGVAGFLIAAWPQFRIGMKLDIARYMQFARHSGWVFLGVSTTELQVRFGVFVAAAWFGAEGLAALNATQILLRPIPLLAAVWAVIGRVDLTRHRDAQDWRAYVATVRRALVLGIPLAVGWAVLVVVAWPLVVEHLFKGQYAGLAWMAGLWGASYVLSFSQAVVSAGVQTLRAFKSLALANTAASVVIAIGILAAMRLMGLGGAVVGTMAGQALEVAVMLGLLSVEVRRAKAAGSLR